jgi:hypothetical protein
MALPLFCPFGIRVTENAINIPAHFAALTSGKARDEISRVSGPVGGKEMLLRLPLAENRHLNKLSRLITDANLNKAISVPMNQRIDID